MFADIYLWMENGALDLAKLEKGSFHRIMEGFN
jgi:hypothetical protein